MLCVSVRVRACVHVQSPDYNKCKHDVAQNYLHESHDLSLQALHKFHANPTLLCKISCATILYLYFTGTPQRVI